MKAILGSVVVISLIAVFFDDAQLSASKMPAEDMHLYPPKQSNGKRDRPLCPPAQRWLCSKAIQRKKARS